MESFLMFFSSQAENFPGILRSVSLQVTALACLVFLIMLISRKSSPRFHYFLWLIVIVRAAFPFNITLPASIEQFAGPVLLMSPGTAVYAAPNLNADGGLFTFAETISILWAATVLLISASIAWKSLRLRRIVSTLEPVAGGPVHELFLSCTAKMNLKKPAILVTSQKDLLNGPAVIGYLRPKIYLPARMLAEWKPEHIEPVLIHELAHIKRHDLLINWLQIIVQAVYFFHPVIWFANRAVRKLREDICDDEAITLLNSENARYGESILRIIEDSMRRPALGLMGMGFVENSPSIKKRIQRIMNDKYSITRRVTVPSLSAIAFVACAGIILAMGTPKSGERNVSAGAPLVDYGIIGGAEALYDDLVYPESAKKAGIEGFVGIMVRFENGRVAEMKPDDLSPKLGYGCEEAAMNALKKQKWERAERDGKPVSFWLPVSVEFRLAGNPDGFGSVKEENGELIAEFLPLGNQPVIKGGLPELMKHLRYPEEAEKAGKEGMVLLQVLLDAEGNVKDTRIIRGVGYGCDEEAVRAVKEMEFTPASYGGKHVAMWFSIPIRFSLQASGRESTDVPLPPPPKKGAEDIPPSLPLENQPKIKGGLQALRNFLVYPEEAKKEKVEGLVLVKVLIDEKGMVEKTVIAKSIGRGCDEATVEAVKKLEFIPATKDGTNVKFWFTIPVRFMLSEH